jgi:hypothetical protein
MVRKIKKTRVENNTKIVIPRSLIGPYSLANSLGLTLLIFMGVYALMIWFGDYDADAITGLFPIPFTFSDLSIILGAAQIYVFGYVFGWILAKIYNTKLRS